MTIKCFSLILNPNIAPRMSFRLLSNVSFLETSIEWIFGSNRRTCQSFAQKWYFNSQTNIAIKTIRSSPSIYPHHQATQHNLCVYQYIEHPYIHTIKQPNTIYVYTNTLKAD
eukprot:710874_1